jgi:drug/metabolite transporter (DMT)-like permease
MLRWWTIGRATGVGISAGLAATILWPLYVAYQERVLWPFLAALAVAALCGLSILLISAVDAILKPRGRSVRPIRAFDVAVGLLLAGPSLIQLNALLA